MRNNDDYWRRLATDPEFEAEMSKQQRELGGMYVRHLSVSTDSPKSARMASMDSCCKRENLSIHGCSP
jgi:hypothetical protein